MTESYVLVPFGVANKTGRMVTIFDVPRGLECNCSCPKCGAALVARKGDVITHHFAHDAVYHGGGWSCEGAVETAMHKMAKQIIADSRSIRLPIASVRVNGMVERVMWPSTFHYTHADIEPMMGGIRPDVVVHTQFRRVAVEVFVAHEVGSAKRAKLEAMEMDTIEVKLGNPKWDTPIDALKTLVQRMAPREWLFCGIQARAQRERELRFKRRELNQGQGSDWVSDAEWKRQARALT